MAELHLQQTAYAYRNKYQTVQALKGVDYQFESGRFYALVGRSGSGKTTLLSLLAGLDFPTEGKVLFNGKPTNELDCDEYRRDDVAVIYQSYNLFPLLTVLENVTYPLELKKTPLPEAKETAKEKLLSVGLGEEYLKRFPAMLSGGEQQRVAIARALAGGAKIILADEPTGNLDEENGAVVVSILQRLAHEEGYCVIVVTHDMGIAERADEVIRLSDGRIVPNETAAEAG